MVLGAKRLGSLITKFDGEGQQPLLEAEKRGGQSLRKRLTPRSRKKTLMLKDVKIGDKLNLGDSPWKESEGVFSCKTVRRADFSERALATFAGTAGARAVSQSSKQCLIVVDRYIVEFTKLNQNTGRVAFISPVDDLYKMRVRTEESMIALYFRTGHDDPMIYNCEESSLFSQLIRSTKGSGMVQREAIHKALHLIQEIQAHERALEYQPSIGRVNEITSLYEKAAKQFQIADDSRYEEVLEHKERFLALPLVVNIVKGRMQKPKATPKREPEILETSVDEFDVDWEDDLDDRLMERLNSNATSGISGSWEYQLSDTNELDDDAFNTSVDEILFEARQDFEQLDISEDRNDDCTPDDDEESDLNRTFEAMMIAADKELEEIRKM